MIIIGGGIGSKVIIGDSSKATANLGSQINMYVVEELVKAVNAVM